jgi:hypothetical protein
MKKLMFSAALACASFAMPGLALADDAMSHDAMMSHGAMGHTNAATMICRPASANEKPTAMMVGANTGIVCKTIHPEMMAKKGSGPDLSHALSADQVDAAWRAYVNSMIVVPPTGGG